LMPNSVLLTTHFRLIHSRFAKAMIHSEESLIIWKDLCGHQVKMKKKKKKFSQEIALKVSISLASTVSERIVRKGVLHLRVI